MRAKTRRVDRRNERRNRRNENGDKRITKGSDRQRPLPKKLGAINKEKGNAERSDLTNGFRQIETILTLFLLKNIVLYDIINH